MALKKTLATVQLNVKHTNIVQAKCNLVWRSLSLALLALMVALLLWLLMNNLTFPSFSLNTSSSDGFDLKQGRIYLVELDAQQSTIVFAREMKRANIKEIKRSFI